jgi:sugar/nucleoside kinase (ribokinase family)
MATKRTIIAEFPSYDVLGVGGACMDLIIPISDDLLKHIHGEKGGALPIGIEELNEILSKIKTTPIMTTGGSCANTIKGLACLNEKCAFLTNIGSDSLGEQFAQYMKNLRVTPLFSISTLPTARVLCLITPDGQRTMRYFGGCSEEIFDHFLQPIYFKDVKLVHLDAYTLRNENLTRRVMQLAKEAHATVSIDLSSFEIIRENLATLMEILPRYADIVFANVDEIKTLTGLAPKEGCHKLQEMCPIAVVLMGKEGCLVGHQGKIIQSPAIPAHVMDSTGAGDLFASGFLYGFLNGYPLEKCARLGNHLGSSIVEVQGAELPPEKWKALKKTLSKFY